MRPPTHASRAPRRPARESTRGGDSLSLVSVDPYVLPDNLPVPEDDGAADHLPGLVIPPLVLDSSLGSIDLAELSERLAVFYVYPRSGRPDEPLLPGWDEIPGARGCTPQSCGFRDHATELASFGARIAGISSQPLADQVEFANRNRMPFPVVADPELRLRGALGLPTFETSGLELYRRMAIVAERGRIVKVFYPVFPPDRNARDVLAWLAARG
jgi:peroxiredoxin